ncbi:MAG: hypothetical protein R3B70_18710 [Polyangiaceae bacterium]
MRRIAEALRVPSRDLDDVVQESLIAATTAIHRFTVPDGKPEEQARRSWLRGIVLRQVANYWRVRGRQPTLRGELEHPSSSPRSTARRRALSGPRATDESLLAPCAEALALARTPVVLLYDSLGELERQAPAVHAVVVAYWLEETPMSEVALNLGISVNTAWNRLRLGRAVLRAHYHRRSKRIVPP